MTTDRLCRVLFVDDERHVLDGLRRALRSERATMETFFFLSAADALLWLAVETCDVVVSDMRMPEMDGAALFGELSRRYPQIHRILLSGHMDAAGQERANHAAHRVLAKPIAPAELCTAIRELCAQ